RGTCLPERCRAVWMCATVRERGFVSAGNAGFTHSRGQPWTLATGSDGDGIQGVVGSTPVGSTLFLLPSCGFGVPPTQPRPRREGYSARSFRVPLASATTEADSSP